MPLPLPEAMRMMRARRPPGSILIVALSCLAVLPNLSWAGFEDLHPGVIGWNTNEEPEAKLIENIEYAYEILKAHNPSHLVTILASGATERGVGA